MALLLCLADGEICCRSAVHLTSGTAPQALHIRTQPNADTDCCSSDVRFCCPDLAIREATYIIYKFNRTPAIIGSEDRILSGFTTRAAAHSTEFGMQMWKEKLSYLLSSPGLTVVLKITECNPRLLYAF
ncbi:uncharacterized protein LOC143372405 [Andrena cerasifolii]|uniref:uncharacterized protein LOC143372405 n=1 Tax=Andrena cerasifolii TaxID=2819439 RepID=UPI004037FE71